MKASVKLSQVGRAASFPLDLSQLSYHNTAPSRNRNAANSTDLVVESCMTLKIIWSWSENYWGSSLRSVPVKCEWFKARNSRTLKISCPSEGPATSDATDWRCATTECANIHTALLISWSDGIGGTRGGTVGGAGGHVALGGSWSGGEPIGDWEHVPPGSHNGLPPPLVLCRYLA